jgi:hypothetical protein
MSKKATQTAKYNPYKAVASGHYDLQKLRIQIGNRIVANFKLRIGQPTSKPEKELDSEGKEILDKIRQEYKLIASAAAELPRISKFKGSEVIADYAELTLAQSYEDLLEREQESEKAVKQIVHNHPLWKGFAKEVSGLGELMTLCILACIDIHVAKYPSSLWKYCGLDVGADGAGRSRRKEHLEEREFVDKDGEDNIREGITFNPFIKTKLIGVLGSSFLRAKNPKFSKIYNDYKHRLENNPRFADGCQRPAWVGASSKFSPKLWRHNKAVRYMIKMFLIDLYAAWRAIEGLPVSEPYHEAKLGIVHSHSKQENHLDSANHSQQVNQ